MILVTLCLAFPALLIYAAWSDLRSMMINNWVSIALALAFVPAAAASGLSMQQFGMHLAFAAIALLVGAALFYMNVFGGGDAKVIAAASIWVGFAGAGKFFFMMAVCGGLLALALIVLRRMKFASPPAWAGKILSPDEGAPYAVAICAGAILAAPASPVLAAALTAVGVTSA
jgi:prepilin peptidase CpaA